MSGLHKLQNVVPKDSLVSFPVAPGVLQQLLLLPSLPPNNNLMLLAQKVETPSIQTPLSKAPDTSQLPKHKPYFKSVKGYFADRTGVAKICRTCYRAVFDDDFVKLFDDKNKTASARLRVLLKSVVRTMDLGIYEDPIMCAKCVEKLFDCHEFLSKCWDTEVKFNHWVTQRKRVQQNDVNLLILLEQSDKKEVKEVMETAPQITTIDLTTTNDVVSTDHSYATVPETVSQTAPKVKKKFSFKLKLGKEAVEKKVKMKMTWKKGPFLCDKCGYTVKTYKCFSRHLSQHAKGILEIADNTGICRKRKKHPETNHKCNYCEKSYKFAKSLEIHVKSIHLGAPECTQCHICGKTLKYASNLRMHLMWHDRDRNCMYICEICGKQFLLRNKYHAHLLIHDTETYPCDVCGKVLKRKVNLEKHRKIYHERTGNVECDICQRPFWKVCDLKKHKIKYHIPGREKKCEICESYFTSEKKLKLHMDTHNPFFTCGLCKAKLDDSESLKQHFEVVHGNQGRFKCEICDWWFCGEKSLLKHAFRVHGVEIEGQTPVETEEGYNSEGCDKENLEIRDCELKEENYFEIGEATIEGLYTDEGGFELDKKNVLVETVEGFSVF